MAITIDMTTSNEVLKELYDGQKIQNMVYKDNALLAMLPKNSNRGGRYYPQPVQYAVGQGRSATFATAQSNQSGNLFKEFLITQASDYSLATIDNRTMLSAKGDKQSFINVATNAVDSAIRVIKNSLGQAVFRSGTGSIGQILSITTGVIVLTNRMDVVQFSVGQALQANATDGGGSPRVAGYVVAVSRSAGTVTVAATYGGAAATPTAWAANDYLLQAGDNNLKIKGLQAWLPFTAPVGGDNFFGVDRSADPVSLAGCRYDGSSQTIEEGLQDGLNEISLYGDGTTDIVMMNPQSYTNLIKSLGSKVVYADLSANATIGFRGVMVDGPRGPVKVLSDRNCPANFAYALQMDTWELGSVGDAPMILTYGKEGLEMLRVSSADSAELRIGYYAQLCCNAPGYNGVIKLSA